MLVGWGGALFQQNGSSDSVCLTCVAAQMCLSLCSDLLRCVCLSDHLSDVSDHTEISRHSHLKLLIFIFVSFWFLFKMPQRVFVVIIITIVVQCCTAFQLR